MKCEREQVGVMVVMNRTMIPGLAKLAERHCWTLIHLPTAACVARTLGRQPLDLAVIHVAAEVEQTATLIRWLRATRQGIHLIAVASVHREELELAVREAGADWYLPEVEETTLGAALDKILQGLSGRTSEGQMQETNRAPGYLRRRLDGSKARPGGVQFSTGPFLLPAGLHGPASDQRPRNPCDDNGPGISAGSDDTQMRAI